jgi:RimJ/RimL family protein N-acetyltransferase
VFRKYADVDDSAVEAMFADSYARKFYPQMSEPTAAEGWINWNRENYSRYGFGLWAIERRDSGKFLGDCGLTYQHVEDDEVLELGYHLVAEHRGAGFATEAGRACLDFAFDRLETASVCSIVDPDNESSIGVSSRLHDSSRSFTNRDGRRMLLFWTERTAVNLRR